MDFYRYRTDGIGVKRNKQFLTQPARSGILLYCDLEAAAFKLQQLVSLSAPRSFRKQNDVFAFFYDIGRLIDNLH